MLSTAVIVGRANVGKSTLFNRLTRTRAALVSARPGTTRDRRTGRALFSDIEFSVTDTGGIQSSDDQLLQKVNQQSCAAMRVAGVIIFLVDGRAGLMAEDIELANEIRKLSRPVVVVVNKTEGLEAGSVIADFHQLGFYSPIAISAKRGSGIDMMLHTLIAAMHSIPPSGATTSAPQPTISVAIVGRQNVGKSTLMNRLLQEERQIADETAGTTRDSITDICARHGKTYLLTDSAGIRRSSKISDTLERDCVSQSLRAIRHTQMVILVVDSKEGLTSQDRALASLIERQGKGLVVAFNKCDRLDAVARERIVRQVDTRFSGFDYAPRYSISALHGTGVGTLWRAINQTARALMQEFSSAQITRCLEEAIAAQMPPAYGRRRVKLRYAHLGGRDPLRIIVHGNHAKHLPASYVKFLSRFFRTKLRLAAVPLLLEFRQSGGKENRNTSH